MPILEGEIEETTLEGKYLITRAGKMIWVSLILNMRPTLFTREVLRFFCLMFENQFILEIKELYTRFQGDISIFNKVTNSKQSTEEIVEDIFHLYLTKPFRLGSTKLKKLSSNSRKIFLFAKTMVHKTEGELSLINLFYNVSESFNLTNEDIAEIIFELVQKKAFTPV